MGSFSQRRLRGLDCTQRRAKVWRTLVCVWIGVCCIRERSHIYILLKTYSLLLKLCWLQPISISTLFCHFHSLTLIYTSLAPSSKLRRFVANLGLQFHPVCIQIDWIDNVPSHYSNWECSFAIKVEENADVHDYNQMLQRLNVNSSYQVLIVSDSSAIPEMLLVVALKIIHSESHSQFMSSRRLL